MSTESDSYSSEREKHRIHHDQPSTPQAVVGGTDRKKRRRRSNKDKHKEAFKPAAESEGRVHIRDGHEASVVLEVDPEERAHTGLARNPDEVVVSLAGDNEL